MFCYLPPEKQRRHLFFCRPFLCNHLQVFFFYMKNISILYQKPAYDFFKVIIFFYPFQISNAFFSCEGAIMHSVKPALIIASAVLRSTSLLRPTMLPKAEILSQSKASLYASANVLLLAAPQGFVCFITLAAGSLNSFTISIAASRSIILLNDSSLP